MRTTENRDDTTTGTTSTATKDRTTSRLVVLLPALVSVVALLSICYTTRLASWRDHLLVKVQAEDDGGNDGIVMEVTTINYDKTLSRIGTMTPLGQLIHSNHSNSDNSNQTETLSSSFWACTANNSVRDRLSKVLDYRPFSLRSQDFVWHHEDSCTTVAQVLKAIRKGKRKWLEYSPEHVSNLTDLEKEVMPSTFVPHQCDIPLLSPTEMCNVLNRFGHVLFHGDSLTRHMWNGLYTTLTNNFQWTGMLDEERCRDCQCDGQWSMNTNCRIYAPQYEIIQAQDMCPHLLQPAVDQDNNKDNTSNADDNLAPPPLFQLQKIGRSVPTIDETFFPPDVDCTDPNYKGLLFVVEGALHFDINATLYIQQVLDPLMTHPVVQTCAAYGKLMLIWQHVDSQSPTVDELHPRQTAVPKRHFTAAIDAYFNSLGLWDGKHMGRLYWLEMTRLAATADGVHKLAQVNYFKAQYIMRLADLMYQEQMYARFPSATDAISQPQQSP